jgi:ABC-type sugar transport system ATPase subunit
MRMWRSPPGVASMFIAKKPLANTLVEARAITQALDAVSFSLAEGEVCAIVGENGAGKSSLMNILSGVFQQDSGRILVRGREVSFRSPVDAQQSGIGIVHQELNLVETLTVLENLFIGRLPRGRAGIVVWRSIRALARNILAQVGAETVPLDVRIDRSVSDSGSSSRSHARFRRIMNGVDSDDGLRDISLSVHAGEVLGLAGLIGAGRAEVARAMFGLARLTRGKILLDGKPVRLRSPRDALAHGISLVPEDRKTEGLNLDASVAEYTVISFRSTFGKSPLLQPRREAAMARCLFSQLHINAPGIEASA